MKLIRPTYTISLAIALALLMVACDKLIGKNYEITIQAATIVDSKCDGSNASQSIKVKNISNKPREVLPKCKTNSSGVQVAKQPTKAKTIKPGKSKRFSCSLQDVADPPDGNKDKASITLKVIVDGQTASMEVPVSCDED